MVLVENDERENVVERRKQIKHVCNNSDNYQENLFVVHSYNVLRLEV